MHKVFIALALALGLVTAGCAGTSKETTGTAAGAIVGSAIGAAVGGSVGGRIAGALIGGAIGALIGNRIGAYLDERDRKIRAEAMNYAMNRVRTGRQRAYRNPKSGNHGRIVPTSARHRVKKRTCRKFRESYVNEEKKKTVIMSGTSCRKADGSWEIVGGTDQKVIDS